MRTIPWKAAYSNKPKTPILIIESVHPDFQEYREVIESWGYNTTDVQTIGLEYANPDTPMIWFHKKGEYIACPAALREYHEWEYQTIMDQIQALVASAMQKKYLQEAEQQLQEAEQQLQEAEQYLRKDQFA